MVVIGEAAPGMDSLAALMEAADPGLRGLGMPDGHRHAAGRARDRQIDTDGRPIGPTQARIVDDAGVPVAADVVGQVQIRGPDMFLGYLDPALNARAFTDDGWFATGDLGVMTPDGYVRIAGREKDVILRGGENLSAKEIEDLLFEHPDVAIVGYPDPVLGERACAFVVSREPLTLEDLVRFLRERRIAAQKLPERIVNVAELPKTASGKRIVNVAELPKTASGKVQKFRLRAALGSGPEPSASASASASASSTRARIRARPPHRCVPAPAEP